MIIENKNGEKLSGILEENRSTKDIVILCHGSRGHKDSTIPKFLGGLLGSSWNTFRFDFSGNGDSEGKIENSTYSKEIEDLNCVVDFLIAFGYKIKAVIGFSKSGSDILLSSSSLFGKVENLVAIAPRINLYNASEMKKLNENKEFFDKNGYYDFPDSTVKHKVNLNYVRDIRKWENIIYHFSDRIPTLVIHGTEDSVTNISESREFVRSFPSVKLVEIDRATHKFLEHLEKVGRIVFEFLNR